MKKWVSIVFSVYLLMASSLFFAVAKQDVSAREGVKGGVKATQQLISLEKRITKASPGVQAAYKSAREWLGEGARTITNKAGDLILVSKDGLRKMRFDINNPHGYAPHIHLQSFRNGKWRDAISGKHHIYPKK